MKKQTAAIVLPAVMLGMIGCRSVLVNTQPPGANICVDGDPKGVTPTSVTVYMTSSKDVTLSKEGYVQQNVELTYDSASPTNVTLVQSDFEKAKAAVMKLTKTVEALVAKKEYEAAREEIWCFIEKYQAAEANAYVQEERTRLMTKVVNVKHWFDLEGQILDTVRPLKKAQKFAEIRTYLNSIKPICTYTIKFDYCMKQVMESLIKMGIPKQDLNPVYKKVRELIIQAFISNGEKYDSSSPDKPDQSDYEKAVKNLYDTLVKYYCKPADADNIIKALRAEVRVLIKKYCVAEETSSALVSLGTTQFNTKLAALKTDILAQVIEGEAERLWADYIKARDAENTKEAQRLALLWADYLKKVEAENREAAERLAKARGMADPIVQSLIASVRAGIAEKDWDGVRATIRDYPRLDKPDVDTIVFTVRIGLLNSEVNPAQLKATLAEMNRKYSEFIEKGELEACAKWLDGYSPKVFDDYLKIVASLEGVAKSMTALGMADETAQENIAKVQRSIQEMLEKRGGGYRTRIEDKDFAELEKALAVLEAAIVDQTMNTPLAKKYTQAILDLMKAWAKAKPASLTTYEMNQQLMARYNELKDKIAYRVLLAAMDREVNFDTQISVAEAGLGRGLTSGADGYRLVLAGENLHAVVGEYARICRLLKRGAKLSGDQKQTLLVAGAYLNQPVVVDWALKLGADVNLPAKRDALARPALLVAARQGNVPLIRSLIEKGAVTKVADAKKSTFLHYAARLGNLDLMKVAAKTNDVNAQNACGRTALFISAKFNHLAQVKALLGLDADAKLADKNGLTAFDVACDASSLFVLDTLLEAGAPLSEQAFVRAARRNDLALARWFVDHGVDVNGEGVMAAAVQSRDLEKRGETYDYLVGQGGLPVPLPVKKVETKKVVAPVVQKKCCCACAK